MVPFRVTVFSSADETSILVLPPAGTVCTWLSSVHGATFGRIWMSAGCPGWVGVVRKSIRFSLMMIGETGPFTSLCGSHRRSSMTTFPEMVVMPDCFTWAASWSRPVSGSSGVRVAPGSSLASLWSRLVKSTVPSALRRPPIVRSPCATSTRSPFNVPPATSPLRFTGVVSLLSGPSASHTAPEL